MLNMFLQSVTPCVCEKGKVVKIMRDNKNMQFKKILSLLSSCDMESTLSTKNPFDKLMLESFTGYFV